jgi:hypothetical protein
VAMQHQAFQCAPQSILTSTPSIVPRSFGYQVQSPRRGKRTRKTSHQTKVPVVLSSSASNWGAADTYEEDIDSTSESDEERDDIAIASSAASKYAPAKKRRHLGLEDVGRFASMSIDRSDATPSTIDLSSPALPPSSSSPPAALKEMLATSVEEPDSDDNDDTAMQARRGATIHQLDSNRFYVSSLSDDSSDEEADADKAKQDQVDSALQSGPIEAREDGKFIVNGVLIDQLQAIDSHRRQALQRERASLRRPDKQDRKDQGALIKWEEPKHLISKLAAPIAASAAAPIVLEEGDYAYVHRPQMPPSSQESDDVMDIDD